jgi:glycosyltransferase involved in cell wall biosynthesis
MKIVMIIPGSGGGFYCENCLRDTGVVKVLRQRGHDATVVPLYLPMFTDDSDVAGDSPVFFGGVRLYLQHKIGWLRHMPRWMERLLDSSWILGLAARQAGSTRARGMGAMTLSMIRGPDGSQAAELDRLIAWLERDGERPDVVQISSILLIGLAGQLRDRLKVPITCVLQDEDTWIDALDPPYDRVCWDALAEQCSAVERFLPVSQFYASRMQAKLGLPAAKMTVVYPGIATDDYVTAAPNPDPPIIGYLSKMTRALGLEILVDAFVQLKKTRFPSLRLRAMGGQTGDDARFLESLRRRLDDLGMAGDVELLSGLDRESRIRFLTGLSVLSVPMPEGEAFGLFIIEALAAGVPVVQPDRGGFTEVVRMTGGGLLYDPAQPDALVVALETMLTDRAAAAAMGRQGQATVRQQFSMNRMADDLLNIYKALPVAFRVTP